MVKINLKLKVMKLRLGIRIRESLAHEIKAVD